MEITIKIIGGRQYVYVEGQTGSQRQTICCGAADQVDSWNKAFNRAKGCPFQARAFICHAVQNAGTVEAIRKFLTQVGVYPYIAINDRTNHNLVQRISLNINNSDMFILLWTPEARDSFTVNHEIGIALDQGKEILILKSKDAQIPPLLQGREYASVDCNDQSSLVNMLRVVVPMKDRTRTLRDQRSFGVALLAIFAVAAIARNR